MSGQNYPGGRLRIYTIADPGAGAQLAALAVPAGKVWRIQCARFRVTTSAVAGNRYIGFSHNFGGEVFDYINNTALAVNSANDCAFGRGLGLADLNGGSTGANRRCNPLPDVLLPATADITFFLTGIDAGDVIAGCRVLVEEFILWE